MPALRMIAPTCRFAVYGVMGQRGRVAPRALPLVTMNRMNCRSEDGGTWTTVRVRALRERLGITEFNPATAGPETINAQEAAHRLGIYITSVHRLI